MWDKIKGVAFKGIVKNLSSIASLLTFLDENDTKCVGSRLENSVLSNYARHTMISAKHHHITQSIIRSFH